MVQIKQFVAHSNFPMYSTDQKEKAKTRLYIIYTTLAHFYVNLLVLTCMVTSQNRSPPVLAACMVLDTVASLCTNLLAACFPPAPPHPISSGEKTSWKLWSESHIYCWKYVDLCSWQSLQVLVHIMFLRQAHINIPILKLAESFRDKVRLYAENPEDIKMPIHTCYDGRYLWC